MNHIGYIDGDVITCKYCSTEGSKLYKDNVFPYKQTCHECGIVIVAGKTEKWIELFPSKRSGVTSVARLSTIESKAG